MMASVRTKDTGPEVALRKALRAAGLVGYRLHRRDVLGCPDLVWLGARLAVFVDGAFWHGHESAFTPGKSGEFWDRKIAKNVDRDEYVNRQLEAQDWTVLRFWDFEVRDDCELCVQAVGDALRKRREPR